jgi:hypothetical protein
MASAAWSYRGVRWPVGGRHAIGDHCRVRLKERKGLVAARRGQTPYWGMSSPLEHARPRGSAFLSRERSDGALSVACCVSCSNYVNLLGADHDSAGDRLLPATSARVRSGRGFAASVTVVEPGEALVVPAGRFVAALETQPGLALVLLRSRRQIPRFSRSPRRSGPCARSPVVRT